MTFYIDEYVTIYNEVTIDIMLHTGACKVFMSFLDPSMKVTPDFPPDEDLGGGEEDGEGGNTG